MSKLKGYFLLASAQMGIAVNVLVGKYLIEEDLPMFMFLGGRFFISSLILSLLLLCKPKIVSPQHPTGKLEPFDWRFLFAQAFTGGFLFNYLFYWGIEYTTAISAGIISSTLPALLAISAYFLLGERIVYRQWIAIMFAMLGILVVSFDNMEPRGISGSSFGDFLVLLAMFPEALYSIFSKYMGERLTSLGSATIVNWMIFFMLLPFAGLSVLEVYVSHFSLSDLGLIIVAGMSGALFYWAWPKGLLVIPASTAAIFTGLLPISTSFLGWYFLLEPFGRYDALGMALVLISLVIGTYASRSQQR